MVFSRHDPTHTHTPQDKGNQTEVLLGFTVPQNRLAGDSPL